MRLGRIGIVALLFSLLTVGGAGAGSTAAKPWLGVTGSAQRLEAQTGQKSVVLQAFLGWGQGQGFGSSFASLFSSLQPVPMIHMGTGSGPHGRKEVITPAAIAQGRGDGYLIALNNAISTWNRLIYVRPLAEMNNKQSLYSYERKHDAAHSPAAYKAAFCRIYVILHGGNVNGRLKAMGQNPVAGTLPANAYPGVLRVIWNPIAGIPGWQKYWPGSACVDLIGNDMYTSSIGGGSFAENEALFAFAVAQKKKYSLPEWGLLGVDDPSFVRRICAFITRTVGRTEMAAFFEAKPGSIADLFTKPNSRTTYRACITPLGGPPPSGQPPPPGPETIGQTNPALLKLTPTPDMGAAPLDVRFRITENLKRPIARWELGFGDGTKTTGNGRPPRALQMHRYAADGVYQAVLIVWPAPFAPGTIPFSAGAMVTVGDNPGTTLALIPNKVAGAAPLAVSFRTIVKLPNVTKWEIMYGDGGGAKGNGIPPRFLGHTYKEAGDFRAFLIISFATTSGHITQASAFADVSPT